jgi:CheY-like chemotaxis protein
VCRLKPLRRILLADDNAHDVELTLAALKENRFVNEVTVVRDGAEVLDYLFRRGKYLDHSQELPALVMLDLKMPKVDGLEVLRQVKANSALRQVPIVMLTSSQEEQDLIRSYQLGVNAYVVKPVDFKKFTEAIGQIGAFWAVLNEPSPNVRPTAS